MTVTSSLTPSQFFDGLISAVKAGLVGAVAAPAITFLQAVEKAPPADTLAGQAVLVAAAGQLQLGLVQGIAQGAPAFIQAEQASIASTFIAEVNALVAKVSASATPAAAPAAIAAGSAAISAHAP